MTAKIFAWLAGLALVMVFLVIISPDLYRGYVFSEDVRSPGQRTYEMYCIGCHGTDGKGDGEAAVFLNPKPRNFVSGDYKYFHFDEARPFPSDDSLEITVRNGLPGSSMPAFPLLTKQELQSVIGYVKNFKQKGWVVPKPIQAAPAPVLLKGESGEELFASAGCIACHKFDALKSVGGVGPDLSQVGGRLGVEQLLQSIVKPNAVIAKRCPAGPCPRNVMPQNYAERLSATQVETLAKYLAEHK
jgi:mono/diheme cytochrome c family protein